MLPLNTISAAGLNGATTAAVDTRTARLIVLCAAWIPSANYATALPTDSKGNTWTALTAGVNGLQVSRIFYCALPATDAAHTFAFADGASCKASVVVLSFDVADSVPFIGQDGVHGNYDAGSYGGAPLSTPSAGGVCIAMQSLDASVSSYAPTAGMTGLAGHVNYSASNIGIGVTYKHHAGASSENLLTAAFSPAVNTIIRSASFKGTVVTGTGVSLSGPSSGASGSASSNFSVGVSPAGGEITGTLVVTPSDGGAGGTFTPTSVSLTTASPTGTFTYTPSSVGTKTISVTNNGGLTNPGSLTYASTSGSFTAGVPTLGAVTDASISISATDASGGSGSYTYQWHRSSTSGFTPGAGTVLAGKTTRNLVDTTASAGALNFYKLVYSDGGSSLTSYQLAASLKAAPFLCGYIGDSIYAGQGLSGGQDPVSQMAPILRKLYKHRDVTLVNAAVGGSATANWLPGQSNYTSAKASFIAAGCAYASIRLGANDAGAAVSAATYGANLASITADLIAAGFKCILHYPIYIRGATDEAMAQRTLTYQAQIDALINGTTILRGDTSAYQYFADNMGEYQGDLTHPTAAGAASLAMMDAYAIARAVFDVSGSVTPPVTASRSISLSLVANGGTSPNSLTGLKWAFFSTVPPSLFVAPDAQGSAASTNSSGVLDLTFNTTLASGAAGWLVVTNSDGTVGQSPSGIVFSGPVTVA